MDVVDTANIVGIEFVASASVDDEPTAGGRRGRVEAAPPAWQARKPRDART